MYTLPVPYTGGMMHAGQLTQEQLDKLHERLRPASRYLFEVQNRMDELDFSKADRLYKEVLAARYSLQLLIEHLHALRCGPSYGGGAD